VRDDGIVCVLSRWLRPMKYNQELSVGERAILRDPINRRRSENGMTES